MFCEPEINKDIRKQFYMFKSLSVNLLMLSELQSHSYLSFVIL